MKNKVMDEEIEGFTLSNEKVLTYVLGILNMQNRRIKGLEDRYEALSYRFLEEREHRRSLEGRSEEDI